MKRLITLGLVMSFFNIYSFDTVSNEHQETEMQRIRWFLTRDHWTGGFDMQLYEISTEDQGCCASFYRWRKGITREEHRQQILRKYFTMFDAVINTDVSRFPYNAPRVRLCWLSSMITTAGELGFTVPEGLQTDAIKTLHNERIFVSDLETKRQINILKTSIQAQIAPAPDTPLM